MRLRPPAGEHARVTAVTVVPRTVMAAVVRARRTILVTAAIVVGALVIVLLTKTAVLVWVIRLSVRSATPWNVRKWP